MQMQNFEKHVWAEIDLDALRANFRTVKQRAGSLPLCAVVKADSYGHGAVQCARVLRRRRFLAGCQLPGRGPAAAQERPDPAHPHSGPCAAHIRCRPHPGRYHRGLLFPAPGQSLSEAAQPPGAGSSASGCGYRHGPHRLCSAHRF